MDEKQISGFSKQKLHCRQSSKQLMMADDFPVEIILDIFSRLPADTLIKLRRVCKQWNNLIRDPDLHQLKWLHKTPSRSNLIITTYKGYWDSVWSFLLVDGIEEGGWRVREIQIEYLIGKSLELVGSCNGLICMIPKHKTGGKWDPILICNPITAEIVCLPKSNLADEFIGLHAWNGIVGFGYDHETRKYKVVRLSLLENQFLGEVITLGESSWRKLDIEDNMWMVLHINKPMLFIDGFIYWIVCWTNRRDTFIVVFDIGSERFDIIKLPHLGYIYAKYEPRLINYEGSLAIVSVIQEYLHPFDLKIVLLKTLQLVGKRADQGFSFKQYLYSALDCRKNGTLYALVSDGTLLFYNCCQTNLSLVSDHPGGEKNLLCLASYHPTDKKCLRFEVSSSVTMSQPVLFMPSLVPLPVHAKPSSPPIMICKLV